MRRWHHARRRRREALFVSVAVVFCLLVACVWRQHSLLPLVEWWNDDSSFSLSAYPPIDAASPFLPRNHENNTHTPPPSSLKYILFYTSYWSHSDFQFGFGQEPFQKYGCPVSDCYTTDNRSLFEQNDFGKFDAVLFHCWNDHGDCHPSHLQRLHETRRRPHQRFVMFLMESPMYDSYPYHKLPPGFYNWTMTYRLDSDLPRPYGWYSPRRHPSQPDETRQQRQQQQHDLSLLASRPRLVAWLVSNCQSTPSKRWHYVQRLKRHIPVDVMGRCGTISCDATYSVQSSSTSNNNNDDNNNDDNNNCTRLIHQEYKFVLALENSFCDDYVTEKLFGAYPTVPIVRGSSARNYHRAMAPPNSYISTADFASPRALAEHLRYLAEENRSAYVSYLTWSRDYEVHAATKADHAQVMCRLCAKLHDDDEEQHESRTSSYADMDDWWRKQSHCRVPHGME